MQQKVCPRCATRYDGLASFCQRDGMALSYFDDEPDPYIGRLILEQFRIEALIGAGGMGRVYRARQTTVDRDVAIKVLHSELVQNPDAVRRFQREAKVSTAVDHPNVVRVFLFGQLPDGSLYLVMEYLKGQSLLDVMSQGSLPLARSLHVATQICEAVGEAHTHGVVHRDIKPENIMLISRGRDQDFVKVLDFGIARFLSGEQTIATQSGLIFGTARYISPEGAEGEHTDARSDVYSIAIVLYQMLCGETPFDSPSPVAMLMKHIHEPPPHLLTRVDDGRIPIAVADVVMRALAKNPDARYADAAAFGQALKQAAKGARLDLASMRPGPAAIAPAPVVLDFTPLPLPSQVDASSAEAGLPSDTVARREASSPSAQSMVARSVRPSRIQNSETLAAAPSPFADTTDSIAAPRQRTRTSTAPPMQRSRLGLVAAFVVGASAVVGGFYAWTDTAMPPPVVRDVRAVVPSVEQARTAPTTPPVRGQVSFSDVAPRAGDVVTIVTTGSIVENGGALFVLREEGPSTEQRLDTMVQVPTAAASHRFSEAGSYRVIYRRADGESVQASLVVVASTPSNPRNRSRRNTAERQLPPPMIVVPPSLPTPPQVSPTSDPGNDRIDWSLPASESVRGNAATPTAPPPWNGTI